MIEIVLFDLDGLLVDLMGPLAAVHSFPVEDWPPGEYSLEKVFGKPHREVWEHPRVLGSGFWSYLPKTPWADDLVEHVDGKVGKARTAFLTGTVADSGCAAGKKEWLRRYYPGRRYLMGSSSMKRYLAAPGRLLIDDSDDNVDAFRAEGGKAYLWPAPWNSRHADYPTAVGSTWKLLAELSGLMEVSP